jgi:hypothetical protein
MNIYSMNPELDEFQDTATQACAAVVGLSVRESAKRLCADGLTKVLAPGPSGLGLSAEFALPVLRAAGAARLTFPLGTLLAATHLFDSPEDVIEGYAILVAAPVAKLCLSDGQISGHAGHVPIADQADWLLAPLANDVLGLIDLSDSGVSCTPYGRLDIDRPVFTVALKNVPAVVIKDPQAVERYHHQDRIFRAIDAMAGAETAMALAIKFLSDRSQFGQPLIGFQSLRHDLARARIELHSLERIIWSALTAPEDCCVDLASMAYARAATCCPSIVEMALHMHGGMGFTWDVSTHLWLRRLRSDFGAICAGAAQNRVADGIIGVR